MPLIQGSLEQLQPLTEVSIAKSGDASRETYRALIDTGATRTCISEAVRDQHDLPFRGRLLVQTAGGFPERRPVYAFSLGLFCQADAVGLRTLFVLPEPQISAALLKTAGFDVLLGMDFLSKGRLLFEHGSFSFEFAAAAYK